MKFPFFCMISVFLCNSLFAWKATQEAGYLTSSFLESRGSRYHAGVDISTDGKEGLALYAPEKGAITRVRLSPFGYGKAIYFQGISGTTYVFAHLNGYRPELWAKLYQKINLEKKLEIDWTLPNSQQTTVEKGALIGYSGSTGIGEPHLHIEVRPQSAKVIDPLAYGLEVKDTLAPELLQLGIFQSEQNQWNLYSSPKDTLYLSPLDFKNLSQAALEIVDYSRTPRENPMSIKSISILQENNLLFQKEYQFQYYGQMKDIFFDLYKDLESQKGDWHLLNTGPLKKNIQNHWNLFNSNKAILLQIKDQIGNVTILQIVPKINTQPTLVKRVELPSQKQSPLQFTLPKVEAPHFIPLNLHYFSAVDSLGIKYWKASQKNISLKTKMTICLPAAQIKGGGLFYKTSEGWSSFSNQSYTNHSYCTSLSDIRDLSLQVDSIPPEVSFLKWGEKLLNGIPTPGAYLQITERGAGIGNGNQIQIQQNKKWLYHEYDPEGKQIWIPNLMKNQLLSISIRDDFYNQNTRSLVLPK